MAIDFKKLLPTPMRSTGKWADLLDVLNEYFVDFKTEKISIFLNAFDMDTISGDDIIEVGEYFGYTIRQANTYTMSEEYLIRQLRTLVLRILYKTTKKGYSYIKHIYRLNTLEVMIAGLTGVGLEPASGEEIMSVEFLDQEADNLLYSTILLTFDAQKTYDEYPLLKFDEETSLYVNPQETGLDSAYLDSDNARNTDTKGDLYQYTRNIIISYEFKYADSVDYFMTEENIAIFKYDIENLKRPTEYIYYEPNLVISTDKTGTQNNIVIPIFDNSSSVFIKSILLGTDFSDFSYLEFGNGTYLNLDGTITSLGNTLFTINENEYYTYSIDDNNIHLSKLISEKQTLQNITELGVFDSTNTLVYYATFPEIVFDVNSYHNIRVNLSLTT